MIFDRQTARQILAGKKTQFSRPVNPEASSDPWEPGHRYAIETKRYNADRDQQERATIWFFQVTEVLQTTFAQLDERDAQREGFPALDDLRTWWWDRYRWGHATEPQPAIWVVRFALTRDDVPRMLHRDSQHGYTHDPNLALAEEPEAVDGWSQERITAEAGRVYSATHAEDELKKEARSIGASLKETVNRAGRAGVDVDEHILRIREELEEMRRKLSDAA